MTGQYLKLLILELSTDCNFFFIWSLYVCLYSTAQTAAAAAAAAQG
jgi:hypothetical protein